MGYPGTASLEGNDGVKQYLSLANIWCQHYDAHEQDNMYSTCTHYTSKHPALSVLDLVAILLIPALKDANAADPVGGPYSIIIVFMPASH